MVLTRTSYGVYHKIEGTEEEVLTELSTAGIRPEDILIINASYTEAVYRKGKN
jgi:hypothetical protein